MKKYGFWIVALAVALIFIVPAGFRPLITSDEVRYAEIPREMLERGDLIVPYLNGVRYFEKTPLGYWMYAASMELFGENAFAVRLPGILAMLGTALLCLIFASKFRNRNTGNLAGLLYLTFPIVFIVGGIAILDTFLTFFLTAVFVFFYFALNSCGWKKCGWLFLTGIFCGFAFLVKGFLAFGVPAVCIGAFLCWEKRWKELFLLPWIPLLGVLTAVLPWGIAIHLKEPDFWHYFFFVEHIQRFFGGEDSSQHSEPFWYFIPVLAVGVAPWLPVLPGLFQGLGKNLVRDRFLRYCLCFSVMPFLLFSLSSGKLPTYILPCFAPFALILACAVERMFLSGKKQKSLTYTLLFFTCVLSFALLGFLITQFFIWPIYLPGERYKIFLLLFAGMLSAALFYAAYRTNATMKKVYYFLFALLPLIFFSSLVTPERVLIERAPTLFIDSLKQEIPREAVLVSHRYPFHDVCWTLKRNDVFLWRSPGEIAYGMNYPDAQGRFLENNEVLLSFLSKRRAEGKSLFLFIRSDFEEDLPNFPIPPEWKKRSCDQQNGYTIYKFRAEKPARTILGKDSKK